MAPITSTPWISMAGLGHRLPVPPRKIKRDLGREQAADSHLACFILKVTDPPRPGPVLPACSAPVNVPRTIVVEVTAWS